MNLGLPSKLRKDEPFCLDDPVAQERTKNSGNRGLQVAGHHAFVAQSDEDSHRIGIVRVACLPSAGYVLTITNVWHTRVKFHAFDKNAQDAFFRHTSYASARYAILQFL